MAKVRQGVGVRTEPPLRELAKTLRDADKIAAKELGKTHRRLGKTITDDAKKRAAGLPHGAQRMATKAFKPSSTATELKVIIDGGGTSPMALAAYLGARSRSGWYSAEKYSNSSGRQHPKWIGNQWTPGDTAADKPYAIGEAIDEHLDEVIDGWLDALESVFDQAFGSNRATEEG